MRHRYAGKRRRSAGLQAAQQPAALRPTAKMAIGRKNEKVDRSPGLALSVVTFPGTRDPQAQDPLLYLRAKLWPELATAVEQEAATYRNISALGAVI